ncbi:MAG: peptidoglycan D,D-transpeptidase FtsI family protein [Eubacteriales bacterium]
MLKKRIVAASMIFLITFSIVLARTGYLLLKDTDDNASQINNQVGSQSILYYPRGKIYDRNRIPLSGRIENESIPVPQYDASVGKTVLGELAADENNTTASGVQGISGLQLLYNAKLTGGLPIKIALYSDAMGEKINSENIMVYNDHVNTGTSLVTTLDYHIQQLIEEEIANVIDSSLYEGIAVVVTEVKTGEILAMASVGDQTNKALLCYQPGSTFKILVAAKALEMGVVNLDTTFQCNGTISVDDVTKRCYKDEGHGEISLLDAFAQSCNISFYQTTALLNKQENGQLTNAVLDLAKEFGFQSEDQQKVKEFLLSYDYSTPTIPSEIFNDMDVFNLALGQGKVMASPLTITKVVGTIANEGVLIEPQILKKEVDSLGNTIEEYSGSKKQVFDKKTNDQLKILLEEVCKTGTGKNNSLEEMGGLAGKSGTAQHISEKENHAWFTGYFPADDPIYAMTVFVEEGGTSSKVALPIYDTIAQEILDLYPQ